MKSTRENKKISISANGRRPSAVLLYLWSCGLGQLAPKAQLLAGQPSSWVGILALQPLDEVQDVLATRNAALSIFLRSDRWIRPEHRSRGRPLTA